MLKRIFTTRNLTYRDELEGDLVYDSGTGTTVERTKEKMIVKVRIDKFQNLMQTADDLWAEVNMMCNWLWEAQRKNLTDFAQLPELARDEEEEEARNEAWMSPADPYLYLIMHAEGEWVIYESDFEYLFLYELPVQKMYDLCFDRQTEALAFWTKDDVTDVTDYLRTWYARANGFSNPENNKKGGDDDVCIQ